MIKAQDVRVLRAARGWTQDELSRRSGVCRSTICRIERGLKIRPRQEQAIMEAIMEGTR